MYKNGRMMSLFLINTTLRLSSHVHYRKSLTCLRVAVVVRDVCVSVCVGVEGRGPAVHYES